METKTFLFACIFLLTTGILNAQKGTSGVKPLPAQTTTGVTRAVVIGISTYEHEHIQDLNYAHRDAEAFVQWLKSPAGGSVPEDNIRLLLNEKATIGGFVAAFGWLREHTQPNDRAFIFFSGHGDVDARWAGNPGYLLTYNTPPQMYMAGAFNLRDLKEVISTLSQQNNARVILIADACRAGKVADGSPGGPQFTNANLLDQFRNEITILSCQADEISAEGVEWGGGRGVFSYYLIEGLYGLADRESDGAVSLSDIDRYLEDHVIKDMDPIKQTPVVTGNRRELLAQVFPELLAEHQPAGDKNLAALKPVEHKGLEEEVLAKVDTSVRLLYYAFKEALATERFFQPEDSCANAYYDQLIPVAELKPLYGAMTRNFAAALIDDAQEALNGWLQSDLNETESWATGRKKDYAVYPAQLEKAAALLGEGHYLYNNLKGKEYFFRARNFINDNFSKLRFERDSASLAQLFFLINTGLQFDSLAPYLHLKMAYCYYYSGDFEKALASEEQAIRLAPAWALAYGDNSDSYFIRKQYKKAIQQAYRAFELDSTNFRYLKLIGYYLSWVHQIDAYRENAARIARLIESEPFFKQAETAAYQGVLFWENGYPEKAEAILKPYLQASYDSAFFFGPYFTSPHWVYNIMGWIRYVQDDTVEAEQWWLEGDSLGENSVAKAGLSLIARQRGQNELADKYMADGMPLWCYNDPFNLLSDGWRLFCIYNRLDETILLFSKALDYYHDYAPLHYHLARLYLEQKNDYEKGLPLLEKAVELDSTFSQAHYHLGAAYAHLGRNKLALRQLQKALENGYEDFEELAADGRWEGLRKSKRYRNLLDKYRQE